MSISQALKFARFYATTKHATQSYSGLPYTHHLAAVEAVLRRFGRDDSDTMLVAAWLHDTVEDCKDVKVKDIEEMFGADVAILVSAVTNEPGENRKIRGMLTYPKIRNAGRDAITLKLADRIANVEAGGKLVDMYRKEYEDFRRALHSDDDGQNRLMWAHLDGLLK